MKWIYVYLPLGTIHHYLINTILITLDTPNNTLCFLCSYTDHRFCGFCIDSLYMFLIIIFILKCFSWKKVYGKSYLLNNHSFFWKTEKLGRQLNVMVMLNREVRKTTKCNVDVKLKSIKFITYIYTDNREIIIVKFYTENMCCVFKML